MAMKAVVQRRPASSAAAVLGSAIAVKAGVDDETGYLIAGVVVAVGPFIASEVAEHGIKGAAVRLWNGPRGGRRQRR